MDSPRSIFAIAAGPRAKWVVFLVWLVGHLHRRRARAAADEVHGRGGQRVHLVPARRRRVDPGADRDRGPPERRARPGGDRLLPRVRPDGGGPSEDPERRQAADREALPRRHPRRLEGGGRPARSRRSRTAAPAPPPPMPGQPAGYAPFVGPVCSQDGKAAIVTAYIKGNGEGDTILDPVDYWRDTGVGPGRRPRGEDHRRRGLLRRRDQGLRGHQRHAAAGRGEPRDRPADPDLPLADLPVHPADGGDLRGDARALARLRPLRARRDDQRPVELDHVRARARRRHRLRAADRRPLPRGAAPPARPPRGDGGRDALGRPGGVRLGRDRDRRRSSA